MTPVTHCVNRPLCPACQAEYERRVRISQAKKKVDKSRKEA